MRRKHRQVPSVCSGLLQKGLYEAERNKTNYGWDSTKVWQSKEGIISHLELSSANKGWKSFPSSLKHIDNQRSLLTKLQG